MIDQLPLPEQVAHWKQTAEDWKSNYDRTTKHYSLLCSRYCQQVTFWQGKHAMLRHENNKLRNKLGLLEARVIALRPLTVEEKSVIDEAWEKFKATAPANPRP